MVVGHASLRCSIRRSLSCMSLASCSDASLSKASLTLGLDNVLSQQASVCSMGADSLQSLTLLAMLHGPAQCSASCCDLILWHIFHAKQHSSSSDAKEFRSQATCNT